jgi:hypothetical protein
VSIVPPTAPLAADGTLEVTVKVTREKDFNASLAVSFPSLPPGVECPASVVIPVDKSDGVVTLAAQAGADLGRWELVAEVAIARSERINREENLGFGTPGGRRSRRQAEGIPPVSSTLTAINVAEPPTKGVFEPVVVEQGKTTKVVCRLEGTSPLSGTFTAKLDGLPPRATTGPVEVNGDAKQVEFTVAVDATTPPGEYRSLVCELAGTVGRQKVVYRLGRGAAFKVEMPGGVKIDANGKPLSPLDALRLEQKKNVKQ